MPRRVPGPKPALKDGDEKNRGERDREKRKGKSRIERGRREREKEGGREVESLRDVQSWISGKADTKLGFVGDCERVMPLGCLSVLVCHVKYSEYAYGGSGG